jgi:hypothetical protein
MILGYRLLPNTNNQEDVIVNNVYIGGVSATMYSPATIRPKLDWIAENLITNVIVDGEDISFRIDTDFSITNWAWRHATDIKWFKDLDGRCKSLNEATFRKTATWTGRTTHIHLPGVETISSLYNFYRNSYMKEIVLTSPNLTQIGQTVNSNESNFGGGANWSGTTLWLHDNLRTANGGGAEADLASFNGTIVWVTDFTPPDAVTDVTVSQVYEEAADITWSAPTSTNGVMKYHVFVNDQPYLETTQTSLKVAGLTNGTVNKFQVKAIDNFYNIGDLGNSAYALINGPHIPWRDSMISYYNFDNNVLDSHGTNDGTAIDVTYEPGISGDAVVLNDTSACVDLGATHIVRGRNEFSIITMFKMNIANDSNIIYGSWDSPYAVIVRVHQGNLQFYTYTSNGQVGGTFTAFSDTTTYHHLVCTYDGASMKMYLDNTLLGTTYTQYGNINSGTQNEAWGRERTYFGAMSLDGGAIIGTAINATEVDEIYNLQMGGTELV